MISNLLEGKTGMIFGALNNNSIACRGTTYQRRTGLA